MHVLADQNLSLIKIDTFPDQNSLVHRFVFDQLRHELPEALRSVVAYSVHETHPGHFRCYLHLSLDYFLVCEAAIDGWDIFDNFRTLCRDVAIYLQSIDGLTQ